MRASIVIFPGSNREEDMFRALHLAGIETRMVWHEDAKFEKEDRLIVLPGGFSYGDYLRAGAIAAKSPIITAVKQAADEGRLILGVCNGFQILTECGLLPGVLMRNKGLKFVCRQVELVTHDFTGAFTNRFSPPGIWTCPIANGEGSYFTDPDTLYRLKKNRQIAFTYKTGDNPNGSLADIAGVTNPGGNVLGMMPHPENRVEPIKGGDEGLMLFHSIVSYLAERA